ncbi:Sortase (surface protein transpeptidase) [Streptomyces venezuelae]|uniref:class E sortase n=1 Tax=Streptomyces gardneri TaxID=66892 RepID=UPI0006E2D359|nr:Sortase (surface protein transpeptidase) [Streptomyces venezuelae]QPK46721.1 class E sortase [Streptomyces gardneri]
MTTGSPWFRESGVPGPEPIPVDPYGHGEQPQPHDPTAYEQPAYGQPAYEQTAYEPTPYEPAAYGQTAHEQPAYEQTSYEQTSYEPVYEAPTAPAYEAPYDPRPAYDAQPAYEAPHEPAYASYAPEETPQQVPPAPRDETVALRAVETPPGPGRAERRRAAKGRGSAPTATAGAAGAAATAGAGSRPLSRVEARRAARAAKESVGVVASRIIGELFITFGVVMLLFVTYQLWWTNVLAGQETDRAKEQIEDTWAKGRDSGEDDKPEAFEPGQGFAIMYIPKLDVVVPIAEGINKTKVLDKGMVGHYADGKLKTAMPSDKQGNFAVAGHRNTHGEPFRYVNQLKPGDPIVVETQDAYYTYEMASILPQTAPSNVSVIDPVPKGSGFTKPGRYITLTTCTPEFTSTYRMIVWGKLVEERPRSKGKPEALVG